MQLSSMSARSGRLSDNDAMRTLVVSKDPALASMQNALPIEIKPCNIANTVAWLVSDEAFYITGAQVPLDAGFPAR